MWTGRKPMSWLRGVSIETFQKQNPDWQVELLHVPDDIPGEVSAHRSDIFRYRELAENGGFYFDTDIVFVRPFHVEHLEGDVRLTYHSGRLGQDGSRFHNVAVLGASPKSPFFQYVYEMALKRMEGVKRQEALNRNLYQLFGVMLLNRLFTMETQSHSEERYTHGLRNLSDRFKIEFGNLPDDLILPIKWYAAHHLYNATPFELSEETIGVHWYGGNRESRRFESRITAENYKNETCYLGRALQWAL